MAFVAEFTESFVVCFNDKSGFYAFDYRVGGGLGFEDIGRGWVVFEIHFLFGREFAVAIFTTDKEFFSTALFVVGSCT